MSHSTVVICLGRNVEGRPMSQSEWTLFRYRTWDALRLACDALVIQVPRIGGMRAYDQKGIWDGKVESACTFVALVPERNVQRLRICMAHVAKLHGQQCIGFIAVKGDSHLVNAAS